LARASVDAAGGLRCSPWPLVQTRGAAAGHSRRGRDPLRYRERRPVPLDGRSAREAEMVAWGAGDECRLHGAAAGAAGPRCVRQPARGVEPRRNPLLRRDIGRRPALLPSLDPRRSRPQLGRPGGNDRARAGRPDGGHCRSGGDQQLHRLARRRCGRGAYRQGRRRGGRGPLYRGRQRQVSAAARWARSGASSP
jgi:hypothetical protein